MTTYEASPAGNDTMSTFAGGVILKMNCGLVILMLQSYRTIDRTGTLHSKLSRTWPQCHVLLQSAGRSIAMSGPGKTLTSIAESQTMEARPDIKRSQARLVRATAARHPPRQRDPVRMVIAVLPRPLLPAPDESTNVWHGLVRLRGSKDRSRAHGLHTYPAGVCENGACGLVEGVRVSESTQRQEDGELFPDGDPGAHHEEHRGENHGWDECGT